MPPMTTRSSLTSTSVTSTSAGLAFGQSRFARWAASALRAADHLAPDLAARLAVTLFFMPFPTKLGSRRRAPSPWRLERMHTGQESFTLLRNGPTAHPPGQRRRVLLVHGW